MIDLRAFARRARGVTVAGAAVLATVAVAVSASAPDLADQLRAELERIVADVGWDSARWSILVVSLDTGDTLFAREPRSSLVPASNLKLVTTGAALHHLGPHFRYETLVLGDGPLLGGTLRGDLILYGTGDPGISDRFHDSRTAVFEALADRLVEAGVRHVEGDVVGDGSFFGGPLLADGWDPRDLNDWFAAPASALSFNENVVTLRVEPASTSGARPTVRTLPRDADVPVMNTATTGRGRLRIEREEPGGPIFIEGGIPRGGGEVWRQMTVADPNRYAARVFLNVLREKGIEVGGGVRTVSDPGHSRVTGRRLWAPRLREGTPRILARHRSAPLHEYLAVVNKRSHNLLAELTLKTLGRVVAGDGSFAGGARAVEAFLADEVGLDTAATEIHDGSGLSALNRLSAGDLVRLLAHMADSPAWDSFWATLPEAGNPRELRRMYRTPAAGNLRAKTGTIENVSALSGLVRSASGERLAFSIIGNDLPSTWGAKRVEDRIGVRLAGFERPFEVRDDVRLAGTAERASPGESAGAESPTDVASAGTGDTASDHRAVPTAGGPTDTLRAAAADADGTAPTTHTVRAGENLTVIARRYEVSIDDLVDANGGISPHRLQVGAELRIPTADRDGSAASGPDEPRRHRVRQGENFTVIARRYGVTLDALLDANPEVRPRDLRPGQWLRIPEGSD